MGGFPHLRRMDSLFRGNDGSGGWCYFVFEQSFTQPVPRE